MMGFVYFIYGFGALLLFVTVVTFPIGLIMFLIQNLYGEKIKFFNRDWDEPLYDPNRKPDCLKGYR